VSILKIKNVTIGEGIPKIIIPLVEKTAEGLLEEAQYVKDLQPDVVEWRVDLFEQVENRSAVIEMIARLRRIFSKELILFTFRSHREGGNKEISDSYYVELNQAAIRTSMVDLVDVELFNEKEIINDILTVAKEKNVFVIMSNHDFRKTPAKEEIISRLRKMQEFGADILKLACMPTSFKDVFTLMDATSEMKVHYADRPIITMSMGGTGVISRLSGELFGSALTFGAGKQTSAPGQIAVNELRMVLNLLHENNK
jgi:3-dehydroquinate dehydratase-1